MKSSEQPPNAANEGPCGGRKRLLWIAAFGLLGLASVALVGWLSFKTLAVLDPLPRLSTWAPQSTAVYDRNGALLRLALARDQRYRLWTPRAQIPERLVAAVLLKEDRWFRSHPGFNPVSLLRGAWITYVAGGAPQGGSTLSMQLARLLWRLETRSPSGKLWQIARALQLEAQFSKEQILEAYLNYAPYGGNIEGIAAASLIYFDKSPAQLSLAETLALAVLPQDPNRRISAHGDALTLGAPLVRARQLLFEQWRSSHPTESAAAARMALPLALNTTRKLPFHAPHLVDQMLAERDHRATISTTLDLPLQQLVQQRVTRYIAARSRHGISNASVLLVDSRDMGVRAMIGSADWRNAKIAGQVNGTRARRSPGSTLKPFIYGLAIDQGVLHPASVLRDVPTAFGPFTPENFDGRFIGPVTASQALVRSRNIPAVAVAAKLQQPNFYQFLRNVGIAQMASESHYGLALVLGGGEVSMVELARLYASLSNDGLLRPLRFRLDQPAPAGTPILSAEAAFMVRDMLHGNPRPNLPSASRSAALPVAWKTGTSWGFRDAWTAGIVGPYVLVVWVGNFDGSGNPALVGVEAAAPLFFDLIDALAASNTPLVEPPRRWPLNLARVEVCRASGDLPNADCPQRGETWFVPGVSPIKVSQIHRRVAIDPSTGLSACRPYDPSEVRHQVFEFWPSELARVYAQAGIPRRKPPLNPNCPRQGGLIGSPPQIDSPQRGLSYTLRLSAPEQSQISLRANADADAGALYWFANDSYISRSRPSQDSSWQPPRPGRYTLRVVDDHGRSAEREVRVNVVL